MLYEHSRNCGDKAGLNSLRNLQTAGINQGHTKKNNQEAGMYIIWIHCRLFCELPENVMVAD